MIPIFFQSFIASDVYSLHKARLRLLVEKTCNALRRVKIISLNIEQIPYYNIMFLLNSYHFFEALTF